MFVKGGFRSFRKTYSLNEVRFGLGTGGVLLSIASWVGWKGAHPDPELFDMSAALLEKSSAQPEPAVERGPLPVGLSAGGFSEGKIGSYSADTLYVKINGRAGFFKSFGVESMHSMTLQAEGAAGQAPSIDIELYDLAEAQNAIGAYNGERPPGMKTEVEDGSSFHFDRNAAFMTRGQYYVRFIGSEESEAVSKELNRLVSLCREKLSGGKLPWAFSLFEKQMGVEASRITYVRKNAFSFGFAGDLFKATLSPVDAQDDVEAFLVAKASEEEAKALADQFQEGFGSLGKEAGVTASGVKVFEDEFLATFSGATSVDRFVIGLRGAGKLEEVEEALTRLKEALSNLSEADLLKAQPTAPSEAQEEGDGH